MDCFHVCFFRARNRQESPLKNRLIPIPNIYSPLPKREIPLPLKNSRYFKTICNHNPSRTGLLSFQAGDVLEVEINENSDLYRAKRLNSDWIGLVSKSYLMKSSLYELQPWFFDLDRSKALRLLSLDTNGPGSFLIRRSATSTQNPFVLTIRCEDHNFEPVIKHYQIHHGPYGYFLTQGVSCDCLETLVGLYLEDTRGYLGLCHRLLRPCAPADRNSERFDSYL